MTYDLPEGLELEIIDVGFPNKTTADILVTFSNGHERIYNVETNTRPGFATLLGDRNALQNLTFDEYGVYWNDDLDISECEIWFEGKPYFRPITLAEYN